MIDCPFCERIQRGDFDRVRSWLHGVVSFTPLNPVTVGHRLFVPSVHIEFDDPGHPGALGHCMEAAALWHQHRRPEGEVDYNLIVSSGPLATQTVPHLHVHYVPRRADDGLSLPWTRQVER